MSPTIRTAHHALFIAVAAFALGPAFGCRGDKSDADQTATANESPSSPTRSVAEKAPDDAPEEEQERDWDGDSGGTGSAMALDEGKMGRVSSKSSDGYRGDDKKMSKRKADRKPGAKGEAANGEGGGGERGAKTRSWFPETFLFEPLLVTDNQGNASLDVRVPDRLTTWRVLALAHSRQGGQAGATSSFLGTLPAYVDPVVPATLRAGDRVRLPLQLVNTTGEAISGNLSMEATNAALTGGAGPVTIAARSNLVRYANLTTQRPGEASVLARLGDTDAVVRTIDVIPTGMPKTHSESGTLAAAREYSITAPDDANPGLGRVHLQVFPGALAILRSELSASLHRGGVADDAFALLLAGKAPALLRALGDTPDPDALRSLTILATQRVVRHARTLDPARAALLADAALAHVDNPVLQRLGERAVSYLERNQVPDGTCGGENGWTLQRLLVATADCARAASGKPTVGIRASGAFERHAKLIEDPYTAAAILASGVVAGKLADELKKIVLTAIEARADGAKVVKVPGGVVRADGIRPSVVEATALAVLALKDDPEAPLADLGAAVLSGYSPVYGWGDGRASLVCMQAVLQLFKDPVPDNVAIVLSMDGDPVASGALTRDKIREVLILEATGLDASGTHTWQVRAEPAVPGLGFALTLTNYVPWPKRDVEQGLELLVAPPARSAVGQPADVTVTASAPSGMPVTIELSWPAGVQVDSAALDRLVEAGTIARYNAVDGQLKLFLHPLSPAQVFTANVRTIPTLAGTVYSGPAAISVERKTIYQPPVAWSVTP